MSTYYLVATTRVGTHTYFAGTLIDDAIIDTTALVAAGGLLWTTTDAIVAAGAVKAQAAKIAGQNEAYIDRIMRDAVDSSEETAIVASLPIQKRTVTITEAGLTNAVNGSPQSLNVGAVLPANARVIGRNLKLTTPFTGGGAASVTLKVGTTLDLGALVGSSDVLAAAVDGQASTNVAGIAPYKHFVAGGAQLLATFTPDGGAALLGLTAGAITIDVTFVVLA